VTLEGWIFMIGLRVFDVGALIVWLIWFFRLRDDDSDDGDDFRGGPGEPDEPDPRGSPPGLRVPLPDAKPWPVRRRDHRGGVTGPAEPSPRRGIPHPVPARAPVKRR
jgi:hypothetical protein